MIDPRPITAAQPYPHAPAPGVLAARRRGLSLIELVAALAAIATVAAIAIPRFARSAGSMRSLVAAEAVAAHLTSASEAARASGSTVAVHVRESPPALTTILDPKGTPRRAAAFDLSAAPFALRALSIDGEHSDGYIVLSGRGEPSGRVLIALGDRTARSAVLVGFAPGEWTEGDPRPAGAVDILARTTLAEETLLAELFRTVSRAAERGEAGEDLPGATITLLESIVNDAGNALGDLVP